MKELPHLFDNNRSWSQSIKTEIPDFFERLAHQQRPEFLWIGCADSRVPANEIIGLMPGEVFVHRNVANVVVHTDLNALSCIQYAVEVLRVRHIIVCGHYGCGGVQAVLQEKKFGLIDNWLRHVYDVKNQHNRCLSFLQNEETRLDRLCELNVIEQVMNVSRTTIVQDAWERGQKLSLHGWVYSLADGLLRDLGMCADSEASLLECYQKAVAQRGQPA